MNAIFNEQSGEAEALRDASRSLAMKRNSYKEHNNNEKSHNDNKWLLCFSVVQDSGNSLK